MEYRYEHDEYTLVRLVDNQESGVKKELERMVNIEMRSRGGVLHPDDWLLFTLAIIRVSLFWLRLALKVDLSNQVGATCYALGINMLPPSRSGSMRARSAPTLSWDNLFRKFGFRRKEIERDMDKGGLLFSVYRHERLTQLAEATSVVELLATHDFRLVFANLCSMQPVGEQSSDARARLKEFQDCSQELIHLLYSHVIPVAFSVLWVWKLVLREREAYDEDYDETVILWRNLLQLYAVFESPFSTALKSVTPSALSSIFHDDIGHTRALVLDVPVLTMSIRELWHTWSALLWRSPGLMPGFRDFALLTRAMIVRMAMLASTLDTVQIMNNPMYVQIHDSQLAADEPLLTVNKKFVYDTERIGYCLLETEFTTRFLWKDAEEDADDAEFALPEGSAEEWSLLVEKTLCGQSGLFADDLLAGRGWWRYVYWDEIERYRKQTKAPAIGPRHVLGDFRKRHTDIISQMLQGKHPISQLLDAARRNRAIDLANMRKAGGDTSDSGWTFRLLWDYYEDVAKNREALSNTGGGAHANVRVYVDPITDAVTYLDRKSGRVIHGEQLRALEMMRDVQETSGGAIEASILEEVALELILNLEQRHDTRQPAFLFVQSQQFDKHLGLHHLIGNSEELSEHFLHGFGDDADAVVVNKEIPCIVSHRNRYAVMYAFDKRTLVYTPHLYVALRVWCVEVERMIRAKLDRLAYRMEELPEHPTAERIVRDNSGIVAGFLRKANDYTAWIPQRLRKAFSLERDGVFFRSVRPDPSTGRDRYVISNDGTAAPCRWDDDAMPAIIADRAPDLTTIRNREALGATMPADTPEEEVDELAWDVSQIVRNIDGAVDWD